MTEPAADRRERYAAALLGPDAAGSLDSAADELIDAVMAVADAELAAVPPADQTADRAAVLREAADALTRMCGYPVFVTPEELVAELRRLAAEAQPVCAECGHPHAAHREGDDPVTPGTCSACTDDDRHDYVPAAGVRQDGAQP